LSDLTAAERLKRYSYPMFIRPTRPSINTVLRSRREKRLNISASKVA
jgi:hypothetical protein